MVQPKVLHEEDGEDADEPPWNGKLLGQSQRCGTSPPAVQPEKPPPSKTPQPAAKAGVRGAGTCGRTRAWPSRSGEGHRIMPGRASCQGTSPSQRRPTRILGTRPPSQRRPSRILGTRSPSQRRPSRILGTSRTKAQARTLAAPAYGKRWPSQGGTEGSWIRPRRPQDARGLGGRWSEHLRLGGPREDSIGGQVVRRD